MQTAVEYLVEQLIPKALTAEQYYHIKQAKQMEKEQIIDADEKNGLYHIGDTNKMVTAVEWLMSQIIDGEIDPSSNAIFLKSHINKVQVLEQAKQMEKEQLNIARLDGIQLANKGYGK